MATDPLARSDAAALSPAEPTEAEYQSFCDTVMATGRGRWFLAEYARRHRKATTQDALDTLSRIEGRLRGTRTETAHLFEELRSLAATIHHARLDIGWSDSEFAKGAKVMALLELLEDRIASLIDDSAEPAPEDRAEPRVQLTVIAANPLPQSSPSRARADLPPVDFAGETTVVALPQPVAAAEFRAARTEIEVALAAEQPTATLAFPAVEMFQPFEVEHDARPDVAAPVDFAPEPFDAEAIVPDAFAASVEEPPVVAPAAGTPGEIELFDAPDTAETEPVPVAAAEPVVAEEPAAAPPPFVARRQLPPGYDPMTPVRALSADERIALVS